ncbi:MAG: NAD(P)/FAD-dependent oxidoreductase [Acidimicrobiia bacterium]|nr:NAD(P)/FAD-dependent oxidoreductase [Acidimicrobiia bacterium]
MTVLRVSLSRRRVVRGLGALALGGALPAPALWAQAPVDRPKGPRVVIVGGGFGGAATAAELRRLTPAIEMILIEPNETFLPGSSALEVAFGLRPVDAAGRSYAGLAKLGTRVIKAEAQAIDPARRTVVTTAGTFEYTAVVLATGVRLAPEAVEGLVAAKDNLTPWNRAHLPELRRRIENLSGGTAVIGVPVGALKCPPAPYEFALLLAGHLQKRGDGRVVLIDSWLTPQPASVAAGFQAAIDAFAGRIEYVPQARIQRVDAAARKVLTADGDEFAYDLLSLIPPNRAWGAITELGLAMAGDAFVDVDPLTQRSRKVDTLYAVGDAARNPFGKNGGAAWDTGRLAARAIVRALGLARGADPEVRVRVACYPLAAPDRALAIETDFTLTAGASAGAEAAIDMKPSGDPVPGAGNLAKRRAWEAEIFKSAFTA